MLVDIADIRIFHGSVAAHFMLDIIVVGRLIAHFLVPTECTGERILNICHD